MITGNPLKQKAARRKQEREGGGVCVHANVCVLG